MLCGKFAVICISLTIGVVQDKISLLRCILHLLTSRHVSIVQPFFDMNSLMTTTSTVKNQIQIQSVHLKLTPRFRSQSPKSSTPLFGAEAPIKATLMINQSIKSINHGNPNQIQIRSQHGQSQHPYSEPKPQLKPPHWIPNLIKIRSA